MLLFTYTVRMKTYLNNKINKIFLTLTITLIFTFTELQIAASAQTTDTPSLLQIFNCNNVREKIFDIYYQAYQSDNYGSALSKLNNIILNITNPEIKIIFNNIQLIFTKDLQQLKFIKNLNLEEKSRGILLHLIRLDLKSKIHPEYEILNNKLTNILERAKNIIEPNGLECTQSLDLDLNLNLNLNSIEHDQNISNWATQDSLTAAHYTMTTAYQSCKSIELDPINNNTDNVQGVEKSNSIDGVGWGRKYTNIPLLLQTHFYHRGQVYNDTCLDQSKKPLVYDYGGVPIIKSSTQLSLFENSGGGSALGIDCSAFISTAVGVAGFRYSPSSQNKSVYTRFVSTDFIDPIKSGWSCYESVKIGSEQTIQSGDIAAVRGHVIMIDQLGIDPFGLNNIESVAECDLLNFKNFNFSVIQSSPSKNSIGLNRYSSQDYLGESVKMKNLFINYGKAACRSKFDKLIRNPKTSEFGIIRHKKIAECQAPRIHLYNEVCADQCFNKL